MAISNLHSMNILVFTYSISQLFMTTDARSEVKNKMIALALDVASTKFYGADLPQGLQHELAQIGEEKIPMEEDEITLN